MPVINIYLKDRVYLALVQDAERYQTTVGKHISDILESYVNYLKQKGMVIEKA